ncbi:MAG: hypothetical protein CL709_07940, partial [Chloroflexi bacterium]|nr:hypothetical protein [Chloroflexota bacterium]
EALLQGVPGGDDGGRLAALRAAAALEASERVDWVKVQGGWDRGVLPRTRPIVPGELAVSD